MTTTGKIVAVNGNMITVAFDGAVAQNEVGYAVCGEKKLMAEIVRVRGTRCDMQVFDATTDLMVDDRVEFTGELLAAELGPGMLAQVYDGLQNPLADLAKEAGKISKDAEFFLQRGMYLSGLPRDRKWDFHPLAKVGDRVTIRAYMAGCDTKGIRGDKAACPNCGRRRGNVRFYLKGQAQDHELRPEDTKDLEYVIREKEKYVNRNPDWYCSFCDTLNSDNAETCQGCGASRFSTSAGSRG